MINISLHAKVFHPIETIDSIMFKWIIKLIFAYALENTLLNVFKMRPLLL